LLKAQNIINWKYNFKLLNDFLKDYARKWTKREKEEANTLSEWVKAVRSLIQIGIAKLKRSMSTPTTSVFKDPDVTETLSIIYYIYDVVPANKAATNIVLICSKHCIDCLHIKLSLDSSQGNPTYTATTLSK
jgi:hypothetical protein